MPKARRDTDKPGARRNNLGVALTDDELAIVQRVADRYGLPKSQAGRLLILAGALQHDPGPKPE